MVRTLSTGLLGSAQSPTEIGSKCSHQTTQRLELGWQISRFIYLPRPKFGAGPFLALPDPMPLQAAPGLACT